MSTEIPINVQDKSMQSINSFPRPHVPFVTNDLTDQYYYDSSHYIRVIAPDIDQTEIHFTDGFHGAGIPDTADFPNDTRSELEIVIASKEMYPSIDPRTMFIDIYGQEGSDSEAPAEETHKIVGNVTEDSKIIVLDTVSAELIKTQNVSAGEYTVTLPDTTVDVLAKTVDDGEPKAHTGVVTVPQ